MKNNLELSRWFAGLPLLLAVILLFNVPAQALEGKVVARVNGQPVYDWEIALAENEIEDELEQVGAKMRGGLLLRYVIDTRLDGAGWEQVRVWTRNPHLSDGSITIAIRAMRDTYFEKNVRGWDCRQAIARDFRFGRSRSSSLRPR